MYTSPYYHQISFFDFNQSCGIVRRIKRSPIRHFIRGCLAASVKRRRTLYEVVPAFYSLEKSLRQFI